MSQIIEKPFQKEITGSPNLGSLVNWINKNYSLTKEQVKLLKEIKEELGINVVTRTKVNIYSVTIALELEPSQTNKIKELFTNNLVARLSVFPELERINVVKIFIINLKD